MSRDDFESAVLVLLTPVIIFVAFSTWAYDRVRYAVTGK